MSSIRIYLLSIIVFLGLMPARPHSAMKAGRGGFIFQPPASRTEVSLVDDLQRTVRLPAPAARIVSLAPSITETLFAIGVGEQVVGVTDYCNYPRDAKSKQRVGGMTTPNLEVVVGLTPDLIVMTMEGNVRTDFAKLTNLGVPVFVTNPRSLDGILKSIRDLGRLTGRVSAAAALVGTLGSNAERIRTEVRQMQPQRVMFLVSLHPVIAVGAHTFLDELIGLAGGVNVGSLGASTYPTLSREAILLQDPDVVLVMSDVAKDGAEIVSLYPEFAGLSAVKAKRVYRINADIVSRPGPRAVEGLQAISSLIHKGNP